MHTYVCRYLDSLRIGIYVICIVSKPEPGAPPPREKKTNILGTPLHIVDTVIAEVMTLCFGAAYSADPSI